jgi:hypothetical protein
MKTTACRILEDDFKFSVTHQNMVIDVTTPLQILISKHYDFKTEELDDCPNDFTIGKQFTFEVEPGRYADCEADTNTFEAFPLIIYKKGIISISIQHDKLKCPYCNGNGIIDGECSECGGDIQEECEDCFGSGYFSDDWQWLQDYYDVDLPEIVHYKTIDLRQGELF